MAFPRKFYYGDEEDLTEALSRVELTINEENTMEKFSWKKELKSFLITFAVGFAMVIYDQLDTFTLDALKNGALLGLIFGAVRAGFKSVVELFISVYSKK